MIENKISTPYNIKPDRKKQIVIAIDKINSSSAPQKGMIRSEEKQGKSDFLGI
ncbi:hypothetical protein YSY22_14530 [Brevibacillus formosus]